MEREQRQRERGKRRERERENESERKRENKRERKGGKERERERERERDGLQRPINNEHARNKRKKASQDDGTLLYLQRVSATQPWQELKEKMRNGRFVNPGALR